MWGNLLFISTFLFVSTTFAQDCRQQLQALLNGAKKEVSSQFEKNSPCYNAAIVGRKNGPPGCFPPGALQLYNLLQPHFKKAQAVCKNTCKQEGLKEECEDLLSEDYLRQQGIQGVLTVISSEFNVMIWHHEVD